jgi:hypothetical protein
MVHKSKLCPVNLDFETETTDATAKQKSDMNLNPTAASSGHAQTTILLVNQPRTSSPPTSHQLLRALPGCPNLYLLLHHYANLLVCFTYACHNYDRRRPPACLLI